MISPDKAGVQFPDSEILLLLFRWLLGEEVKSFLLHEACTLVVSKQESAWKIKCYALGAKNAGAFGVGD